MIGIQIWSGTYDLYCSLDCAKSDYEGDAKFVEIERDGVAMPENQMCPACSGPLVKEET